MKLRCPRCETGLAKRWSKTALYQLCAKCHGIAITRYAVAHLGNPTGVQEFWRHTLEENRMSEMACPSCLRKMWVGQSGDDQKKFELDICPPCSLIWFDRGEHDALDLRSKGPDAPKSAVQKAKARHQSLDEAALASERARPSSGITVGSIGDYGWGTFALTLIGLPVEEDGGPLERYPLAMMMVFVLTVALSIIAFANIDTYVQSYGFHTGLGFPRVLINGIGSFFIHIGWLHLIGNMYFLVVFGDDVENELGHLGFLALLFGATLLGDAFYALTPNAAITPCIGASGGVSGLMAYYMVRFPYRRFRLMFLMQIFSVRASLIVGFFFFKDLIGAVMQMKGIGHVSHLSHLGGAAVGVAVAAFISYRESGLRYRRA
ncbi:MAG TPA: rhomboid family intramembrane serine protease [Bdellovibrionota bacterium]|jgi:membrane associated rhomboid family serine protease/Zn-finger nucleic acid-binding protein